MTVVMSDRIQNAISEVSPSISAHIQRKLFRLKAEAAEPHRPAFSSMIRRTSSLMPPGTSISTSSRSVTRAPFSRIR